MKIGAIVIELREGGLHAIPFNSTVPMVEMARKIRDAGVVTIGKKSEAVLMGVAIATGTPHGEVMKFRCVKPVVSK
jgi:hypothetical protein